MTLSKRKRSEAAKLAYKRKVRYQGMYNVKDKKEYYDTLVEYAKERGQSKLKCNCCGEKDWKFLVFDHIGPRPKSQKNLNGIAIARKLKKIGKWKKIQILCHNCNTGKEIYGTKRCPHKLTDYQKKKLKRVRLLLK